MYVCMYVRKPLWLSLSRVDARFKIGEKLETFLPSWFQEIVKSDEMVDVD